jgi:DNA-directed RNA polymerase delta subunit
MFLNLSTKHKGSVDKSDFELLHKFLPLGENIHPNFKEWVSEEEKKALNEKSSAKTTSAKKRKKKKKQSNAASAVEESSEESDSHPIDVLCEDISADLFNRMKESSNRGSQNTRSHQHATEDDEDDGDSGGAQQCRVQ